MKTPTLQWTGSIDGTLELIDQRVLPLQHTTIRCTNTDTLFDAIQTLAVRGAPAIGVAAAYGVVIGLQKIDGNTPATDTLQKAHETCAYLAKSRPTAVNLFWALDRMSLCADHFVQRNPNASSKELRESLLEEANKICTEDQQMCIQIGLNGQALIQNGTGILTHCNAGALATAGQGTALSIFYEAKKAGKDFTVYADETRPLLQGARLTSWELQQAKIKTYLICDNMTATLMKEGKIQACITGADRIAANGDAANKIGTYGVALLAKHHNIPFYIAAPSSTFDLSLESGKQIPIEERSPEEVTNFGNRQTAPNNTKVRNPAFDVTEAELITAIITEKGIIEQPNTEKVREHLAK